MAKKRARFIGGPDPARVHLPDDSVYAGPRYVVEPNAFLPSDAPQRIHDELGARDDWRLEDAPDTKKDES